MPDPKSRGGLPYGGLPGRLCRHFGTWDDLSAPEDPRGPMGPSYFEWANRKRRAEPNVHGRSVTNALVYTRFLIRDRIRLLRSLDERKEELPPAEYVSCRRSLLQGIEELKVLLSTAEYDALPFAQSHRH